MNPVPPQSVGKSDAHTLYRTMNLARSLEARLAKGIRSGEFNAVIWPSRGQEAVAAGMGRALRRDDRLVTTYRGLHDMVAKGIPLTEIIGEVIGRTTGASGGKGGTMHITCPDAGVMLTTGIVGAGVPVGVGLALAARQQGSDRVTAVTFGDGATNTGAFHEGMNLAATWQLPVVFICQNNKYAEMTPIEETMRIERVADRALGYAMTGVSIDGNDPEVVYRTISEAAERARAGGGPTLVECVTFRFEGHYLGDAQAYMPKEELAAAKEKDPIPTYRATLLERGLFDEAELDTIEAEAKESVEAALAEALAAPTPDPAELDRDFFADMEGIPA